MIAAIVQARMASTRLPGKSLAPLAGRPLIAHVFERIAASREIGVSALATTTDASDDPLVEWATAAGIRCVRGPVDDVLKRYRFACDALMPDAVVRITADDPFKDPDVIDATIGLFRRSNLDFAYNNKPPSYPEGLDAEVFTAIALRRADDDARDPFEREHMTQHLYRNPALFRQANLSHDRDLSHLRWTIDTEADLKMARMVYERLYVPGRVFRFAEILALLAREPHIAAVNAGEARSAMYRKDPE